MQIVRLGGTASDIAAAAPCQPAGLFRSGREAGRRSFPRSPSRTSASERTPDGQLVLVGMERANGRVLVLAGADLQGYAPPGGIASLPLAIFPFRGV